MAQPAEISRWSGLLTRSLSGIALLIIVLCAAYKGGLLFDALLAIAAFQLLTEWHRLTRGFGMVWVVAGIPYVVCACLSLLLLRALNDGMLFTFFLILTIAATDIGAFFAGRTIGGPKLAPIISPNKTWAGLGGGMIGAACVAMAFAHYAEFTLPLGIFAATGMLIAVVAQAGDLLESWVKRRAGVKDSGNLIPGHGGLLDRMDGYMFTAPLLLAMIALYQGPF